MDGIVTVLKPPGMTSSNVVYDVRKIFNEKKVGHLGTLDPGACGILPVCIGKATKLFDLLVEKRKTYIFEICFGAETDTMDSYGNIIKRCDRILDVSSFCDVLSEFNGQMLQKAPAYSALKVNGQKMYDLARNGNEVPDRYRNITIDKLELLKHNGENRFLCKLICSRGTYVRTLCSDIGERLSMPSYMSFLLRTDEDIFTLQDAYTIQELQEIKEHNELENVLMDCETALSQYPTIYLSDERRRPTKNGLETSVHAENGKYRVYADGFLGLGEVENRKLKLKIHLYDDGKNE